MEHRKALRAQIDDWTNLRRSHPQHILVIGGDFNQSRDGSGWYEDAESVALLSKSLKELDVRCLTQEDFRVKFQLERANIDHICVSASSCARPITVGAWPGTVNGVRMSDHNGVYVDIDA